MQILPCITPPTLVDRLRLRIELLTYDRHCFSREQLRRIVLSDFKVHYLPDGSMRPVFH